MKRSWYLVATEEEMIPPDAQRAMAKRAGALVTRKLRAPKDRIDVDFPRHG